MDKETLKNQVKTIMTYSPLEQFEIVPYFNIGSWGQFSITNSAFFILLVFILLWTLFTYAITTGSVIPTRWQAFTEMTYDFIHSMVLTEVGARAERYFPLLLTTFLFVLGCNLQGMIPYTFTATSHLVITLGFALSLFIGVTIIGFQIHGLHYFSMLLPSGVPLGMAPMLIPIELVSYIFRVISLSVRLFANIMSGHALLKILGGFTWKMIKAGGGMAVVSLFPLVVVFAISGLEIGIACLQAYVFTVLTCLYLKDAIHLH